MLYWTRHIYLVEDFYCLKVVRNAMRFALNFIWGKPVPRIKIKWTIYIVLGLYFIKFCLSSITIIYSYLIISFYAFRFDVLRYFKQCHTRQVYIYIFFLSLYFGLLEIYFQKVNTLTYKYWQVSKEFKCFPLLLCLHECFRYKEL